MCSPALLTQLRNLTVLSLMPSPFLLFCSLFFFTTYFGHIEKVAFYFNELFF